MKKIFLFLSALFLLILFSNIFAQKDKKGSFNTSRKTAAYNSYTKLNINNVSTFVYNDGISDLAPTGDDGFIYPKGSGKAIFFSSGLLWGGNIGTYWSVGGSAYISGLQPGRIMPDGTPEDQTLPHVRIFRVRSDFKNFTTEAEKAALFATEISEEKKTADEIYQQYLKDWNEWPAVYGAPFIDVDGNGIYNPAIDIPGLSAIPCQTVWYVANDLNATITQKLYGALPMAIEVQVTMWAFPASKPFDNTIFRKYKIINRNTSRIDSMFTCLFSDPDLGSPYDDYVGCDSTLGLGFVYNSKAHDEVYGYTPPAAGFVMLQTPFVSGNSSDIAKFESRKLAGFKNLGMTGFYYSDNGGFGDMVDPWQGSYIKGALCLKNLFQTKSQVSGAPIIDPVTKRITHFKLNGDPFAGTGWLDGSEMKSADRRMYLSSGPFTMNPGDTQEVILAQTVAGDYGKIDNLQAVLLLKQYTRSLFDTWNGNIAIKKGIAPNVTASALDSRVILNWSDSSAYVNSEKNLPGGYNFEGYNIYQLPSATSDISQGTLIGTFDLINNYRSVYGWTENPVTGYLEYKVVAFGTNSGIKRYINITKDTLADAGLINYSKYYFGVTSYYVTALSEAMPRVIESPLNIFTVIPQPNALGMRLSSAYGDTLAATFSGTGTVNLIPKVINPKLGTGNNYTINFAKNSSGQFVWSLKNDSGPLLNNYHVYPLDSAAIISRDPIIDGVQFHVYGLQKRKLGGINISAGSMPYNPLYNDSFNGELWYGNFCTGIHWLTGTSLDTTNTACYHNIKIKYASVNYDGTFSTTDVNASKGYRFLINGQNAAASTSFAPFIINHVNYGFQEFGKSGSANIPLAVYDTDTGKRLALAFTENNITGGTVDGYYMPPSGSNNSTTKEYLFILGEEYNTTPNSAYTGNTFNINPNGKLPIMYFITSGRYAGAFSSPTVLDVYWNKPISETDKFTFTIPGVTTSTDLAKEDADKINVFPNPYYYINSQESGANERFVTFTHLPQKAVIKIFNIAGQLIKIIRKDDTGQIAKWDLTSDGGHPAASGIYAARIELPDLSKIKILKLAIFQRK